ncbi:MAG: hypothetical protein GY701_21015 [Sulfitobacter sp.]|nr:hypothetical protein [Sulfitobacter sp.]
MATRNVQITAVPLEQVDFDKLVSGLLLQLEELAATDDNGEGDAARASESDR